MFDFDLVTTIAALILLLVFAAPIYYNLKKSKRIRTFQLQVFQQNVIEKGMNITHQESWRDRYYIGLDSAQGKLLYIEFQEVPRIVEIYLSKVKTIELHEKSHEVGSGNNKRKIIDNLDLTFYFKNQKSNISLEFYDGEKYSDMEAETPLTRKWYALIKSDLIGKTSELAH